MSWWCLRATDWKNNLCIKSRWRSVRRFQRRRDVLRRRERVPFFYRQRSNERVLSGREEEGSADVDAMTNSEVLEVEKWIQFYRSGGSQGRTEREAC